MHFKRVCYLFLGLMSFGLGFIGAFLPVLPTTPFMLLAAFFFSKSSERFHQSLLNSKLFGPTIRDWENQRVIRLRAKIMASSLMTLMISYPLFFKPLGLEVKFVIVAVCLCALIFIWSCPSRPDRERAGEAEII